MFIDGGMIAIFFLVIMLTAVGLRHNRQLSQGSNYALFRFAILLSIIMEISPSPISAEWVPFGSRFCSRRSKPRCCVRQLLSEILRTTSE
jgi:hypothetical protein